MDVPFLALLHPYCPAVICDWSLVVLIHGNLWKPIIYKDLLDGGCALLPYDCSCEMIVLASNAYCKYCYECHLHLPIVPLTTIMRTAQGYHIKFKVKSKQVMKPIVLVPYTSVIINNCLQSWPETTTPPPPPCMRYGAHESASDITVSPTNSCPHKGWGGVIPFHASKCGLKITCSVMFWLQKQVTTIVWIQHLIALSDVYPIS